MAHTWSELEPRTARSLQAQNMRCTLCPADGGRAEVGDRKWAWEGGARRKSVQPEGEWMVLTWWKRSKTNLRDILVVLFA